MLQLETYPVTSDMVAMVLQENRDKIDEAKYELGGITKKIDALTGDVRDLKAVHRQHTGILLKILTLSFKEGEM